MMIAAITTALLHMFLALQLLTPMLVLHGDALPITSKPIESTAENLAWQAWLMLPPEQKSQEKSRKVTPKSIFTLPFRQCPPGHQLFESRCIPTVNIDPTELLTQLGFVAGDATIAGSNYEFDYEDEPDAVDSIYDMPQKLNVELGGSNYDDAAQLPSQDEPLKFNIFQQKFPMQDYEAELPPPPPPMVQTKSANKSDAAAEPFNSMGFFATINGLLESPLNGTSSNAANFSSGDNQETSASNNLSDLQTESTQLSAKLTENPHTTTDLTAASSPPTPSATSTSTTNSAATSFAVSDIDAIVFPAVHAAQPVGLESHNKPPAVAAQQFSLFKDDSAVQLLTTIAASQRHDEHAAVTKQQDISQLLKVDALMPLVNITQVDANDASALAAKMSAKATTAVFSESMASSGAITAQNEDAVTISTLPDGDGTPPTQRTTLSKLLEEAEEEEAEDVSEKEERVRSIATAPFGEVSAAEEAAQEVEFTTTLEPDVTTNFQLDETTIIEAVDPPAIELQELLAQQVAQEYAENEAKAKRAKTAHEHQHQQQQQHVVLKKSKVEPVRSSEELVEFSTKATPTVTTAETTTTTATATEATQNDDGDEEGAQHDGRLFYEHMSDAAVGGDLAFAPDAVGIVNERGSGSNLVTNAISRDSRISSSTASEIDIENELRMINELVKGKRQTTTTTTDSTKMPSVTATTESSLAAAEKTTATKSTLTTTTTSASNNEETVKALIADGDAGAEAAVAIAGFANDSVAAAAAAAAAETNESSATSATTAAATTTTTEPTATLWSKILPMLGLSTTPIVDNTPVQDNVDEIAIEATTTTTTVPATTSHAAASNSQRQLASSINSNRSIRNSKIIRINSLSANSVSVGSAAVADKHAKTKTTTPTPTTVADEIETTSATATATATTTEAVNDFEPFWWLPIGWSLDNKSSDVDIATTTTTTTTTTSTSRPQTVQPLLLRFWSAFQNRRTFPKNISNF